MSIPSRSETSLETAEENLLRITLQEHVPQNIDPEPGWASVSTRLFSSQNRTAFAQDPHNKTRLVPGQKRRLPRWQVLVAAAAVLIVLSGASLFGSLSSLFGGNQAVYAKVATRQQQDQGVTIDVIGAYADEGQTCVAAKVALSPELAQKYKFEHTGTGGSDFPGNGSSLTYQQEALKKILTMTNFASNSTSTNYYECFSAANAPADASEIALTWQVTHVTLIEKGPDGSVLSSEKIFTGDWSFHFTTPFHHEKSKQFVPNNFGSLA